MKRRDFLALGLSGWGFAPALWGGAKDLPPRQKPDRVGGPPLVSAKSWAILEGATGKCLWGDHERDALAMASTTKIMTGWLVLELARNHPKILEETVVVSAQAAKTGGSTAALQAGDRLSVRDLLHGLLLPSGNDAAVALAEHCGLRYREKSDPQLPAEIFLAQMNRRARTLELEQTRYIDPHGMGRNLTSAANLGLLAWNATRNETFRLLVQTRRHACEIVNAKEERRTVTWNNTNRLLEIEGYEGIKTGTTTAAGSCLASSCRRGKDQLFVVVLGSTSNDNRYLDTRNLYRWAWRERGHAEG